MYNEMSKVYIFYNHKSERFTRGCNRIEKIGEDTL